jgi:mono/diheme cytochrome c family protein
MKKLLVLAAVATVTASASYAAASNASAATRAVSQDPTGQELYEANCRKCHGVRGTPPKTMKAKYPKIATFDAEFFTKHSEDSIVTILTRGKGDDMKSFKEKMSKSEMAQVAAYIRSLATK